MNFNTFEISQKNPLLTKEGWRDRASPIGRSLKKMARGVVAQTANFRCERPPQLHLAVQRPLLSKEGTGFTSQHTHSTPNAKSTLPPAAPLLMAYPEPTYTIPPTTTAPDVLIAPPCAVTLLTVSNG